mgnify:CR=1 FL=1
MELPIVYVAIPAMDELQDLPLTLQDLARQTYVPNLKVYVCVNQPETYWQNPEKISICLHNEQLMYYLQHFQGLEVNVIDKSSKGHGWVGKDYGVGWARKYLFECILSECQPCDIIVSLDADTRIQPNYIQTLVENLEHHPHIPAIAVPYYHPLSGIEAQDRALLRYEMYMRNYAINLMHIQSPYGFTAIGSAIAMRAKALRKIGGITPLKSGEDFYLVQKFRKMAPIGNYNEEIVYPAARLSDRVVFGTGPAIIKGTQGEWSSYPIYSHQLFEPISEAYSLIPELFQKEAHCEFIDSLNKKQNEEDAWHTIRQNTKDLVHFELAFHEKADGLRILQFLRQKHKKSPIRDEKALFENMSLWTHNRIPNWYSADKKFNEYTVKELNELRNLLFALEMELRKTSN